MWISIATRLIIFILLFVLLVWILRKNESQAGERLLLLPQSKYQKFIFTVLCLALFIVGFYLTSDDDLNFYFIIGGAICIYAVGVWIQNFFPIELHENGITIAGSLIKWSRIKAYEWTALERLVLKSKPKYLSWQRKWTVRVSSAKREKVEQILEEKLSNF